MAEEVKQPEDMNQEEASEQPQTEESEKCQNGDADANPPADEESENLKIIVRHLNYKTTEDVVKDHFAKYGSVKSVEIKKDPDGTSRGFGFVVFETRESVENAVKEEKQQIDNHETLVSLPIPLSDKLKTNMMFIGGVSKDLPEDELRDYFKEFGTIKELTFTHHRDSGERRNYCFLHFEESEAVEKVMKGTKPPYPASHTIGKFSVDCRRKFPEDHPETKKLRKRQEAKRFGGGWGNNQGGYGGGYGNSGYGGGYGNSGY